MLEGGPTQMGIAHGRLLDTEVRFLVRQIDRHIFQRIDPIRRPGIRIVARALAFIMGSHIPENLKEEIRGISLGSGISYSDLLLLNTLDDVLNILRRFAPDVPAMACSSFAVFGERTWNGELLHGRNLDYHFGGTLLDDKGAVARLLLRKVVFFAYHPIDRAAFISISWPGMVGVTTAVNEAGLCLGNLTSYTRDATPSGVPTAILYRTIVEQAATLRDVGRLLRGARRTVGNNLIVSSGLENRAALFEITMNSIVEVAPEEGVLVATNHFVSPDLARRQRPYIVADSVRKRERLHTLCEQRGIARGGALAILADAGGGNESHPLARIANEGTAVSVLFRPTAGELWFGTNPEPPASAGEFKRVSIDRLLKAA